MLHYTRADTAPKVSPRAHARQKPPRYRKLYIASSFNGRLYLHVEHFAGGNKRERHYFPTQASSERLRRLLTQHKLHPPTVFIDQYGPTLTYDITADLRGAK